MRIISYSSAIMAAFFHPPPPPPPPSTIFQISKRHMVHFHGSSSSTPTVTSKTKRSKLKMAKNMRTSTKNIRINGDDNEGSHRPMDPELLSSSEYVEECAARLLAWLKPKSNVLVLTGAGLSTASGIPDYRGHNGSYQHGHKPMIHDQFISSEKQRQRYWGRSMVGWRSFAESSPNSGHDALTTLEKLNYIGVQFEDHPSYYSSPQNNENYLFSNGLNHLSIITQNVDGLHRKANTKYVTELHGRGDVLKCMTCGAYHCRHDYHDTLEEMNQEWIRENVNAAAAGGSDEDEKKEEKSRLRPDGDGFIAKQNYEDVIVPPCPTCLQNNNNRNKNNNNLNKEPQLGFLKPDVVFFGDSVPRHRVQRCYGAVKASDGLLCIGSSLAVHSAFRFVRAAAEENIPIAILNVGLTRAEEENRDEALNARLKELVMKIEAPAAPTLSKCVDMITDDLSITSSKTTMTTSGDLYGNVSNATAVSSL